MNETQMKMVCFYECVHKQWHNETSNNIILFEKKENETKWNEIIVLVVMVMEIDSLGNSILYLSLMQYKNALQRTHQMDCVGLI